MSEFFKTTIYFTWGGGGQLARNVQGTVCNTREPVLKNNEKLRQQQTQLSKQTTTNENNSKATQQNTSTKTTEKGNIFPEELENSIKNKTRKHDFCSYLQYFRYIGHLPKPLIFDQFSAPKSMQKPCQNPNSI